MASSSSGAGATVHLAPPLPQNPYTNEHFDQMTTDPMAMATATATALLSDPSAEHDQLFTPNHHESDDAAARVLNGLAFQKQQDESPFAAVDEAAMPLPTPHGKDLLTNGVGPITSTDGEALTTAVRHEDEEVDLDNAKAYAKLVFTDGDFFITTTDVVLGRNMERFEQMRRRKKSELRARAELDTYRKEPSQPSQPGDGDQQFDASESSHSLEGRPAPPSNFSEHGGPVWYPSVSEDEAASHRPKARRRISHFSKSSSTNSIAPANLHAGTTSDPLDPSREPATRTVAFIPIHTQVAEDIGKISKEHLIFRYNFELQTWELTVAGNRAFINDVLVEKNAIVPLHHDDEIMIATISMTFKLPDNPSRHSPLSLGTFSQYSEADLSDGDSDGDELARVSTSPVRRLSNAMLVGSSEDEDDDDAEKDDDAVVSRRKAGRKLPKLKLSTKTGGKKPAKSTKDKPSDKSPKPKQQTKGKSVAEPSPEATRKVEAEKKLKEEATTPAEDKKASPAEVPFIKPGSVLEGIPMEELPEKRKGPGRPPKEGNVSKRDTQLANKKRKEYEKKGEEPPPFKVLVDIVRRESKFKEMQAKMEANGQLEPGQQIMASIEVDAAGDGSAATSRPRTEEGMTGENKKATSPSAKPKRMRAISPVKPEAECTPEELKKPDYTYVHIIDQILNEHPSGQADLQEIYELIMKKYPYYKYRQSTMGWQSSVRHNLLQSPRFTDVGRSGKGKLWTIDHDIPLDKEKKRRGTPPRAGPSGQFAHHGGAAPYGNVYGQQQPNGQMGPGSQAGPAGSYYPPYPHQHGQHPQHYYQPGGSASQVHYANSQSPAYAQQHANGSQPAQSTPTPYNTLVQEILDFNKRHLASFPGAHPQEIERQGKILSAITEYLSDCHSYGVVAPAKRTTLQACGRDALIAFGGLAEIFRRHKPDILIPDPWRQTPPQPAQAGDSMTAQVGPAGPSVAESAAPPQATTVTAQAMAPGQSQTTSAIPQAVAAQTTQSALATAQATPATAQAALTTPLQNGGANAGGIKRAAADNEEEAHEAKRRKDSGGSQ
ncbi:hypothetical protein BDY17DRAFT_293406 [Neohortaea acidophila]|uniref:Fork-head domain-containing protein n=1 Tax=Neohortaea acidophila TaxID=245834 RepID=A0A6A6PZA3_9PEZI|nr:uncharacterized protein BDY17DRAFT_293406 [Neohortaea acidophila]KAF2485345.1 hypothetical protein BDY17DRAFT_293406 [Neohortaea acidophila]